MTIATTINNGKCPECKADNALSVTIVLEGDLVYGDVSCTQCLAWITDLMPEELLSCGIDLSRGKSSGDAADSPSSAGLENGGRPAL